MIKYDYGITVNTTADWRETLRQIPRQQLTIQRNLSMLYLAWGAKRWDPSTGGGQSQHDIMTF